MDGSFSTSLLSLFSQPLRIGKDVENIIKRYEALAIIYANFGVLFCVSMWNLFNFMGMPLPCLGLNISILPLLVVSFVFLKRGNLNMAVYCVIAYMHLTAMTFNKISNAPFAAVCALLVTPPLVVVSTSSYKTQLFNIVLCLIQYFIVMFDAAKVFEVTLTVEQYQNICQLQVGGMLILILSGALAYFQKVFETNIWQSAQSNFERAEKINQEVMQAIKSKDTFISSLSHEIRNPLNAMKGSIDYLLKAIKDPGHIRVLENAHLSSEVLLQLLNNVLDAAKLKAENMELAHAESSMISIIKKTIAIYTERLMEKKITTQVFLDKHIPSTIWVDSSRLLQIVMNLVSNALKFTPTGGRIQLCSVWCDSSVSRESLLALIEESTLRKKPLAEDSSLSERSKSAFRSGFLNQTEDSLMEFRPAQPDRPSSKAQEKIFKVKTMNQVVYENSEMAKDFGIWSAKGNEIMNPEHFIKSYAANRKPSNEVNTKGYLKVQVSDTGIGISEEHLPHLFNMFSQGRKDVASVYGGSGLGLWICKQLCQKMGGDITIYTQSNVGTTFVFYIPIDNGNIEQTITSTIQERGHRKNVRALVVDDYSYNREIHKLLLEREGVEVNLACDGKEALEKYISQAQDGFDFILMDIQMPEMDGFTAAKKIREFETTKKSKRVDIIFVSGEYYNEQELMSELKAKGHMGETSGVRCLRKPVDVEAIRTIVSKFSLEKRESLKAK